MQVTVVDRRNHHLFQPLLYQVATAGLNPADIAAPTRRILRRQKNVEVLLAEVRGVDVEARRVELDGGDALSYDHLVVATGATHAYFGRPEWAAVAPGLKTIEDAIELRRRILVAFERAERETDPARRRAWLTFVVVGGGPTGVELAGAVAKIARHTLASEFRHIDPHRARIILLQAGDRILPSYSPASSRSAQTQLERLGVYVHTGVRVTAVDEDGVSIGRERVEGRTVLWAAGVAASPLGRTLGAQLDTAGRVVVTPELTLPSRGEVLVGEPARDQRPSQNRDPSAYSKASERQSRFVTDNTGPRRVDRIGYTQRICGVFSLRRCYPRRVQKTPPPPSRRTRRTMMRMVVVDMGDLDSKRELTALDARGSSPLSGCARTVADHRVMLAHAEGMNHRCMWPRGA